MCLCAHVLVCMSVRVFRRGVQEADGREVSRERSLEDFPVPGKEAGLSPVAEQSIRTQQGQAGKVGPTGVEGKGSVKKGLDLERVRTVHGSFRWEAAQAAPSQGRTD